MYVFLSLPALERENVLYSDERDIRHYYAERTTQQIVRMERGAKSLKFAHLIRIY